MVDPRGAGRLSGLTIADALREFEARGYIGQFVIRGGGSVECTSCGTKQSPRAFGVESMRRIEGASDPADMAFIGALRCPQCGTKGTAVVPYGPQATPEAAHVLRELHDDRVSATLSHTGDDPSLVRDTGWLRGPDG